jgi:RNA polymerase sigma-70 factor (ECF subfamily)
VQGDKKNERTVLDAQAGIEATDSTSKSGRPQVNLRNMAGLKAQLTRVTGSTDLASDLLQDAVVTALQKLRAGEITDPTHLDGYVYRVALNHLRNYRRKDRAHAGYSEGVGDLVDATDSSRPAENLEAEQWARLAKKLLQEVSPARDRELLVRFYLHEECKEELCRAFGLTELHFNRVIYRARDRFRELLRRRGLGKSDFFSTAGILILAGLSLSAYGIISI